MTLLADCRACGGKQHGRATFPLSPSPLQGRLVEQHGPCPFDGSRCAFCGFLWAGHPPNIINNPDPMPVFP